MKVSLKIVENLRVKNKLLAKELKQYKRGYGEMICYFDSIDEDEQIKLSKRLDRIFKINLVGK